jgi:phosphate transport system permease protein
VPVLSGKQEPRQDSYPLPAERRRGVNLSAVPKSARDRPLLPRESSNPPAAPLPAQGRPARPWQRLKTGVPLGELLFDGFTASSALITLCLVLAISAVLAVAAEPTLLRFKASFLISTDWDPVNERFGALPFIYGTVVSSLLALIIALPFGVGVALCLSEMAPFWLSDILGFLVELLAAVPSVVYGLWGIFVLGPFLRDAVEPVLARYLGFLPLFQGPRVAVSMLSAGTILAVMVVPYISAVCRDVFSAVPASLREAAFALGATRWEVVRLAVLPHSISGIIGAVILGLGRALGETIAVAMVIGNRPAISASLFMPATTLASAIANEFTEATSDIYVSALIELGLVLILVSLLVNVTARLMIYRLTARRFSQ